MGKPWTEAEKCFLVAHFKSFNTQAERDQFLLRLQRVSHHRRTWAGANQIAKQLNLQKKDYSGLPTLREFGEELGVNPGTMGNRIRSNPERFPVLREGAYTFVPEETQALLREVYARPPEAQLEGTISSAEAAAILCVTRKEITALARYGVLDSIRVGPRLRIVTHTVYRARDLRSIHGANWLSAIKHQLTDAYEKRLEQNRNTARAARKANRLKENAA